jgi:hypothetical protein
MNDDTTVSTSDVLTFSSRFGLSSGQPGYSARWDIVQDGSINVADVLAEREWFGTNCRG